MVWMPSALNEQDEVARESAVTEAFLSMGVDKAEAALVREVDPSWERIGTLSR